MQTQIANIGWVKIEVPLNKGILRCQLCGQDIGLFDPEKLAAPIDARMFQPIAKGYPHPFRIVPDMPISFLWENASCPYCRNRPFLQKDAVMTPNGLFKVNGKLPKKPDKAHDLSKINQEKINEIWAKELENYDEDVTMEELRERFPDKTQSELNQLMINTFEVERVEREVPRETKPEKPDKTYPCDYCDEEFPNPVSRYWHHKKKHGLK